MFVVLASQLPTENVSWGADNTFKSGANAFLMVAKRVLAGPLQYVFDDNASFEGWAASNGVSYTVVDQAGLVALIDSQQWAEVPASTIAPRPVYQPPPLSTLKANRVKTVDIRTGVLIAGGFTVDGKVFSASDTAQLKWLGMYTSRTALSYPVTVPTKDDSEFVSIINTSEIETYYNTLLARIQAVLSGGVTLKAQIVGAASQAALDAIVDNRT